MKQLLSILTFLLLATTVSFAQNNFYPGDMAFSLELGIPHTDDGIRMVTPAFGAQFEYTVMGHELSGSLSVGAFASYDAQRMDTVPITEVLVGPMLTYRYPILDKFDVFAKVILGYYSISAKFTGEYSGDFIFDKKMFGRAAYIGGSYYLSDKISVGVDVGYGFYMLGAHLSYKF